MGSTGMQPLVSILIPAYNSEAWLAETIQSALSQTWKKTEIIVVDDGSSDRTVEVAKQFESRGVQLLIQSNQGASAARNTAFTASKGDYIQWLDADDQLHPEKISSQMAVLNEGCTPRTLPHQPGDIFSGIPEKPSSTLPTCGTTSRRWTGWF